MTCNVFGGTLNLAQSISRYHHHLVCLNSSKNRKYKSNPRESLQSGSGCDWLPKFNQFFSSLDTSLIKCPSMYGTHYGYHVAVVCVLQDRLSVLRCLKSPTPRVFTLPGHDRWRWRTQECRVPAPTSPTATRAITSATKATNSQAAPSWSAARRHSGTALCRHASASFDF